MAEAGSDVVERELTLTTGAQGLGAAARMAPTACVDIGEAAGRVDSFETDSKSPAPEDSPVSSILRIRARSVTYTTAKQTEFVGVLVR